MPAPCTKMTTGSSDSRSRPPVAAKTDLPSSENCISRSLRRGLEARHFLRGAQCLRQVVDDVVGVFEPDGEAYHVLADAGGGERGGIELLMRGARGMDDERLGVA